MSGTSGRTLPVPFGFYDPDTRSLRTSRTTFDSASTLSCATLPTSGSMLSGALYARTRSGPRISAAGSSSSPLLPTPRTSDTNGAGEHGEGGPDLRTAVSLLPTPNASDAKGSGSTQGRERDGRPRPLSDADLPEVVNLLPRPRASGGEKGGPNQRGSKGDLALPSTVVQPLPTPTVADSRGTRNATSGRTNPDSAHHTGTTLNDLAFSGELLPTPTAADGDRTSTTYSRGNPTLIGAVSPPPSGGGKRSRAVVPPGQLTIDGD